ncbi:MAG: MurT ligase domain-containing protein [Actinomycetota bacterium]|nr:MurT ligase domain-containing protein [Actinomycetota bacterium]
MPTVDLPLRTRVAALAGRAIADASRLAGAGEGSVIGGRVTLAIDKRALELMAAGHQSAVVSGTNGKTTTTRLLAAALATRGPVNTNSAGANLLPGLVSSLFRGRAGAAVALEVDEGHLAEAVAAVHPTAVVLLNLSRDQLDRFGEVRRHASDWRLALAASPGTVVVANADDPLVTWAAGACDPSTNGTRGGVTWVGTGQRWRADASACPNCGSRIRWTDSRYERGGVGWACTSCPLVRPRPDAWLEGSDLVLADGRRFDIRLQIPGRFNMANAAMAVAGAMALGVDPGRAVRAMARVRAVAGRYQVVNVDGARVRLLLAKNPAGWAEALDLIRPPPIPVVVGINAGVADGRDPSWLWDVPFERLKGRLVVATGERGRDLAVRLRYAEVRHTFEPDYRRAVTMAAANVVGRLPEVDFAANYTAFQDARRALTSGQRSG